MIDFTPLLQALIGILATVITGLLIPWIKARTTIAQQMMIKTMVIAAVTAAEQIYGAGGGETKLAYVEACLKGRGVKVNTEELKAYIEAAVFDMQHHQ